MSTSHATNAAASTDEAVIDRAEPVVSFDQLALGATIRELRGRHAITQEEFGFRAGLHRNYVGALERGEVNPQFRTLLRVAQGLDVRLSVLIAGYEERRPATAPAGPLGG